MIKVAINRNSEGYIEAFTLEGHAGYANPGEDIVCSAVTAVSFGTVNALEVLLNIKLEIEMEQEGGFLHCLVPQDLEQAIHEKAQLLLESMLVSLQSIASEYGKFLSISETKRRGI